MCALRCVILNSYRCYSCVAACLRHREASARAPPSISSVTSCLSVPWSAPCSPSSTAGPCSNPLAATPPPTASLKCCCVGFFCRRVLISVAFSRARHIIGGGLLREEKGGLRFFLLGLWVRVKNVVGVLVADANAWMQILNFKCVRRVRLPAKEGLNCSSSRLAVMMLARDFFSSRACDKDLSLTTLLLFSLLFHSYTKQQAERKQTHTYT